MADGNSLTVATNGGLQIENIWVLICETLVANGEQQIEYRPVNHTCNNWEGAPIYPTSMRAMHITLRKSAKLASKRIWGITQ